MIRRQGGRGYNKCLALKALSARHLLYPLLQGFMLKSLPSPVYAATMADKSKTRALVLISGGLDSILAARVLMDQGIDVTGITFSSAFFGPENAKEGAKQVGCDLRVIDISEEHLALVKDPPRGYGKNMNPCIDCHMMMVKKACELAKRESFDVVATGEVLNERPMSQNRDSLGVVARGSGYPEMILRPLSAKHMEPTEPELKGLVDREKLYAIEGRTRKIQMGLAKRFGIKKYIQPAGGCLLTDPEFSKRLKELFTTKPDADIKDVALLKCGRHFRLPGGAKLVVGRDEKDNEKVLNAADSHGVVLISDITPGPISYLVYETSEESVRLAGSIAAAYADNEGRAVDMLVKFGEDEKRVSFSPMLRAETIKYRI